MTATEEKRGFWAKCRACAHCWIAAYLPMDIMAASKMLAKAACPMCGDSKPLVAAQDSGELLEPAAS
jgi:hypothetical protein